MRTLKKNKQKMYYASQVSNVEVYQRDENGNIVYKEFTYDGITERVPVSIGILETAYSEPEVLYANICSQLTDVQLSPYGSDTDKSYATIVLDKEEPVLKIGTRIWCNSEVKYNEDGSVDEYSADYSVTDAYLEELNENSYRLQKLTKED